MREKPKQTQEQYPQFTANYLTLPKGAFKVALKRSYNSSIYAMTSAATSNKVLK